MGIRPNSDGVIPVAQPDNPETRYSDWLTDFEDSGEIVGGVWQETDAKATSAKDAADDLAGLIDTHKHVSSDVTDTVIYSDSTMGIAGRIPRTGESGFLHQRDVPTHNSQLANKLYVDQQVGQVQNQPITDHQHVSADITDKLLYADSQTGVENRLVMTGADGFLYSRDMPYQNSQLARKGYVDQEVNNTLQSIDDGEQKNHKHISSDIQDATFSVGGEGSAGKVLRTGVTGQLAIQTDSIVKAQHVTNKRYVDDENAKLRELIKHAVIAVPPASLEDLPAGQVYLDVPTLTIHTK